ncbi:hypothetical protein DFQ26_003984 [Actinomortierella ambigua]|nr:hypothetical protein DFQ26_003984 [Actinomortierella ambigua]
MEKATIRATYSVTESATVADASKDVITTSESNTTLTFQDGFDFDATGSSAEVSRKHLDALSNALKTMQATINTGLTERLVATGVLSAEEPGEKKKVRTKVVGQTQQHQGKKEGKKQNNNNTNKNDKDTITDSPMTTTNTSTTTATAAPSSSSVSEPPAEEDLSSSMDVDQQVASKKAFGEDDENQEDAKNKDEVDLLMEADPGEVDGACLELPKDDLLASNVKRQSESAVDVSGSQASKKAKGE